MLIDFGVCKVCEVDENCCFCFKEQVWFVEGGKIIRLLLKGGLRELEKPFKEEL